MLDLLRDPVWQFIGALLAILGIAAAFWIYWLQRQTRELAFGIVSSRRLLSVADELSSRVTVQLDGQTVKNLHLLVYGIKNSGHRSIAANDFERPLSISFADGRIVSAEVASQVPPNLGARLDASESRVVLQPLLLNAGDQILLQILLSAPSSAASIDTRIVDVPALAPINVQPRLPPFHQSGMPPLIVISLAISAVSYFVVSEEKSRFVYVLGFAGFAVFSALFSFSTRFRENFGVSARRYISET